MGSTKIESQTQTQAEPTAAELEMQELQLGQFKETMGPQTQAQLAGLDLVNQLLMGQTPLPGFFGEMGEGISTQAIGQQASQMARQAMPGFQQLGLADSGVAFRETARGIANELLFPAEQFNIGAKQNLLNLALSGQAQVQSPVIAGQQLLSNQLQGLRSVSGTSSQRTGYDFFTSPFTSSLLGAGGTAMGGFLGRTR